jgi:hypothetical protein
MAMNELTAMTLLEVPEPKATLTTAREEELLRLFRSRSSI